MARFGDVGPYSIDNVKIILHEDNCREGNLGRNIGRERTADHRTKISKGNLGKIRSPETREMIAKELAEITIYYQNKWITIREASAIAGNIVSYDCVRARIKRGWDTVAALETPGRVYHCRGNYHSRRSYHSRSSSSSFIGV
jgi:hypothetical protein